MTTKFTLTEAQKLQLWGLQTIAQNLTRQMDAVEAAAREITGEDELGFTQDFLLNDMSVDDLIERLSGPHASFKRPPGEANKG